MFIDRYPNFTKGRILKAEMLETVRDYSREWVDLQYQAYSDGIISGCEVVVEAEHLIISPGILKHQGRMYRLADDYALPLRATNQETLLKVRFHQGTSTADYTAYRSEVVLDGDSKLHGDELELGRFKLKEGAQLRTDYQSFQDFVTEYNTFIIIHTVCSGLGKSTLHPSVVRYFAHEVLKSGSTDVHDLTFAMNCLNQGYAQREVLQHYLSRRLGARYQELSNETMHKQLGRILDRIRSGGRGQPLHHSGGPRRMIVD